MRPVLRPLFYAAIVAACLLAVYFLWNSLGDKAGTQKEPTTVSAHPGEGGILSRLSLLPGGKKERSLFSVIIENHEAARPHHAGLSSALLIQEFPVEGFITRFSVLFDLGSIPSRIGPVRSLRPYFVDAVRAWRSPILHAGGSPEAFEKLATAPLTAINGLAHPKEFFRDEEIPAPHDVFINEEDTRRIVKQTGVKGTRWPPYETGGVRSHSGAFTIFINFYNPDHNIRYTYDFFSQGYIRDNGGIVSDTRPANVLIVEIPVAGVGEHGRLDIPLEGSGPVLLFRNNVIERGTWEKREESDWFTFKTDDGLPLIFARGQTWMTVLPSLERVTWK